MGASEGVTDRIRARLGGLALIVGGLMYAAFWVGPVRDRQISLVDSHGLQLIFYGSMIASLGFGLWRVARAGTRAPGANLLMFGLVLAMLGLVSFLWIQALGFLIIGGLRIRDIRNGLVGYGLFVGSVLWFVVWALGARFDSENSAPLNSMEKALSTSVLILIAAGLIGLGIWLLRETGDNTP